VSYGVGSLAVALVAAGAALHAVNRHVAPGTITGWWLTNAVSVLVFGVLGTLVVSRRGGVIGWILLGIGLGHALTLAGREYGIYALEHGLPAADWAIWLGTWSWMDIGLLAIVFVLFPDGRLPSRRWLPVPAAAVVAELVVAGGNAVYPGPMFSGAPRGAVDNPLAWAWAGRQLDRLGSDPPTWLLVSSCLAAALSILARAHDARPAVRRQVLLVAPAALALAGELAYEVNGDDRIGSVVSPVVITLLGCAIGAAILRYGLYELDIVVSRAVVYALLTALLVAAYIGLVAGVQALALGRTFASLLAAALVAVVFAPLRLRAQSLVDRWLYGARGDPYAVIATLGARLSTQADDVLQALAETVAHTLKLPYVAVELDADATEVGTLHADPLVLQLAHRGEPLGRLVLAADAQRPVHPGGAQAVRGRGAPGGGRRARRAAERRPAALP
jgi:hypothetical protein